MAAVAAPLSAQQKQSVIATLNKATAGVKSMSAAFTQTKSIAMLNDKLTSNGVIYFSSPSKLRWEYKSPYQYTFILNNTKVYVANANRKDVIDTKNNKVFKEIARIMMSTVTGTALSGKNDFSIDVADGGAVWKVSLTPKKRELRSMFSSIMLHFNKSNNLISEIQITEKNKDLTHIKLKNLKTNIPVNASLFAIP